MAVMSTGASIAMTGILLISSISMIGLILMARLLPTAIGDTRLDIGNILLNTFFAMEYFGCLAWITKMLAFRLQIPNSKTGDFFN